ncbi:DNA-binding response regulator [Paenibacillus sambharensis]|uniref:DNA-binding response regulator n=1 Tax=Paenibacillus sambharensis TaxID=1803190 RepID=A0A2W1LIU9_9BACL|nr:response regulator transcription factor [Paenibacillus sambharensis]PZD94825.1 DNA-binding response regulator [Paenibacillus sambharensis]
MAEGEQGRFRVLIADDHPDGREGMRDILSLDADFLLVGEAQTGEEAVEAAARLRPDLVLMDVRMPGIGGLEATQRIKQANPAVKVVMVTVSGDITHLFEALKRGAQGYLLKNLTPSAWHEYLRSVAFDEAPMTRELAYQLLREFDTAPEQRSGRSDGAGPGGNSAALDAAGMLEAPELGSAEGDRHVTPLTGREREILERVAMGESNRVVAETLGISEHTVKNHLKNILQKLHLDNRVQLTRYALQQGLVERRD